VLPDCVQEAVVFERKQSHACSTCLQTETVRSVHSKIVNLEVIVEFSRFMGLLHAYTHQRLCVLDRLEFQLMFVLGLCNQYQCDKQHQQGKVIANVKQYD
jgi:hypothetical protein